MNLKVELSDSSIDAAINRMDEYRKRLDRRASSLPVSLAQEGCDMAQTLVHAVSDPIGNVDVNVSVESAGEGRAQVVASGSQAAFLEFGVGVVGQGTYDGDLPSGWGYNEHRTPDAYRSSDPDKWTYFDGSKGKFRMTKGMAAVGYMSAAANAIRAAEFERAKEVFR